MLAKRIIPCLDIDKGRVVKLADANFVKNFDKDVRERIYKILFKEFKGKNPN